MSEKTGILPTVEQWEAAQKEIEQLRVERDQARRNCLREVGLLATEHEEHAKTRVRLSMVLQALIDTIDMSMYGETGLHTWQCPAPDHGKCNCGALAAMDAARKALKEGGEE